MRKILFVPCIALYLQLHYIIITNKQKIKKSKSMEGIVNLKHKADSFNFLGRTTGGISLFIAASIFISSIGIVLFFYTAFKNRIGAGQGLIPEELIIFTAICFALILAGGSYFSAINQMKKMSTTLFWFDTILSICSYSALFIPATFPQWGPNPDSLQYGMLVIGAFIVAATPPLCTKYFSEKLWQATKNDNYVNSLNTQFETAQQYKVTRDMKKIEEKNERATTRRSRRRQQAQSTQHAQQGEDILASLNLN